MLLVVYLFRVMQWPGLGLIADVMFWVHIGAYLLYSLQVPDKDSRMVYPMLVLVLLVVGSTLSMPVVSQFLSKASFFIILGYSAFHLLVRDYMGVNHLKPLKTANIISLSLFGIAGLFKTMQWPGSTEILAASTGLLGILLMLSGVTKDLVRSES